MNRNGLAYLMLSGILWITVFLAGRARHKRIASDSPAAIRLPWLSGLFFGSFRSDHVFDLIGTTIQLSGYHMVVAGIVWASECWPVGVSSLFVLGNYLLILVESGLTSWWIKRKAKKHCGVTLAIPKQRWQMEEGTLKAIPIAGVRPPLNRLVVGVALIASCAFIAACLWLWLMLYRGNWQTPTPHPASSATLIVFTLVTLPGIVVVIFANLAYFSLRLSKEGLRILTLSGYRSLRWSDVIQMVSTKQDEITLLSAKGEIQLRLGFYKSPEAIIAEIAQRVEANSRLGKLERLTEDN